MNRFLAILLPAFIFAGYIYLLNTPIKTGSGTLPAAGIFFNPFCGFWQNAESSALAKEETIHLPGLKEEVTISFDQRLVPHVFSKNEEDLVFAQGYLHARYRLWQMDITARQASGRLSEIFGSRLLDNDQRMRRMGLARTARVYAEQWHNCPEYQFLSSYAAGINQYIGELTEKNLPFEFKLFGYKPEAWSVEKTGQVALSMNLMLCGRNEDLMATNTLEYLGAEDFKMLFPRWNPKQSPIIPKGTTWNFKVNQSTEEQGESGEVGFFPGEIQNDYPRSIGSNNWAVMASKTRDGFPILCNDPHLTLTLPSIWYEMQMQTSTYNAYGVSLPGIPYIAIGFNDYIAWGETNVGMDVSDLYEISWQDDRHQTYLMDGVTKEVSEDVERYEIKGEETIFDTIKLTEWGPVFIEEGRTLALKWLPNLTTDNCMVGSFRLLNQAKNFDDYYKALKRFESPAQNFAFASQTGDVALKVQGALPIKPKVEGQFILDGTIGKNDWRGYIPYDETPFIKNPERGFVSSANQNSTDTTYPYRYHGYFDDYRGRTLNEALTRMQDISVEDMQKLQNSTYSKLADDATGPLIALLPDNLGSTPLIKQLKAWNYYYTSDGTAPIIFEIWFNEFYKLMWDEFSALEEEKKIEVLFPEIWRTIALIAEDPTNKYFDIRNTPEVETAADLARQSFEYTEHQCDSLFSAEPDLVWKNYRPLKINHLSRVPAFSVTNIDVGGVASALNSVKSTHGPSWRMIVQLGNPIKAWGVYPGGQSGNPGSPYYKNMIDDWAAGHYYPLLHPTNPGEMNDHTLTKLSLKP
ncbi:MAG: penicillin acylase family protein [Saprospiraceae bacterium]|nr:penicillin acylase family protein [Saprospiraceae bacterium]